MYTVIALALILLGGVPLIGTKVAPESLTVIFLFLAYILLTLAIVLSIPLFFYFQRKSPLGINLRQIYRTSLKWSIFASFGISGLMALNALDLITFVNTGLFVVLYVVLFVQLKK